MLGFISKRVLSSSTPRFNTLSRCFSTQVNAGASGQRIILSQLRKKYISGVPLTMLTAYDYTSSIHLDRAGIDVALVGDSLGMVMLGRNGTNTVTMEEMIMHCNSVSRGCSRAFIVADMPFGSYQTSNEDAVRNAVRFVKEGNAMAVKLEVTGSGSTSTADRVKAIVDAGIPVMGHVGLTPQTSPVVDGYHAQGKTAESAYNIYADAVNLQKAGCFSVVVESVPELLGQAITKSLAIPTFGIGAGKYTSGQVLVYHDLLGLYPDFVPKFCKVYVNLSDVISKGLSEYKREVEERSFPAPEHVFSMKSEEWQKAIEKIEQSKKTNG